MLDGIITNISKLKLLQSELRDMMLAKFVRNSDLTFVDKNKYFFILTTCLAGVNVNNNNNNNKSYNTIKDYKIVKRLMRMNSKSLKRIGIK